MSAIQHESKEQFNLLYPDLLTKDAIIEILKKRYIKLTELDQLQKDELVELYNQYVLPLPQRKHRLNRRGREMTKKQIVRGKKRKHTEILNPNPQQNDSELSEKRWSTQLIQNHLSPSPAGDRLKPPPSCINLEKKTLKLTSGSSLQTAIPISSSMNQLKINQILSRTNSGNTDLSVGGSKKITLKGMHVADCSKDVSDKQDELKSTEERKKTEELQSQQTPMDTSETSGDEMKPKKVKIKRIPWP